MNFQGFVRRTAYGVRRIFLLGTPVAVLLTVFLSGCVRVAGTAGYSKINPDGETTVKQAGFDTANLVPGAQPPGNITVN
ncbi:MAG: hypothetical protein A2351_01325 [Omnitrophica bacterium RIFOXYB12_FULL_50_7]|nr:MAG: hypothetical protein A2351_01325 [Omnitrophica bacterium RIFOXYB12_FULL_50_7]